MLGTRLSQLCSRAVSRCAQGIMVQPNTFMNLRSIKIANTVTPNAQTASMLCRIPQPFNLPQRSFHIKLKKKKPTKYRARPHHASVKRYWVTGTGRIMRFRSGLNHKRRRKSTEQLRRLHKRVEIPKNHYRRVRTMLMIRRR